MTSLFRPPNPVPLTVGGGGGIGGSAISNATSSVIVIADPFGGLGAVQILTNDAIALSVDLQERIIIGDPTGVVPYDRLTLVDPSGNGLKIINTFTNAWGRFLVADDSSLTFATSSSLIDFASNKLFISSNSLHIGATAVTSSAAQLIYTNVTPGTAVSLRALVVDERL
ncbi:hypothetical protein V7S43_000162 [Phytophthora oleae]|uniref:DUF4394 domain-containing protein n=1 Tax=Phytophthora oleae TaxID=2107226 RepID=A0ABD3G6H4_9STRA